jgi:GcrA cell cycle regulator
LLSSEHRTAITGAETAKDSGSDAAFDAALRQMRDQMSDTSNVWTDDRLAELKKLWDEGLSISQIGVALGVSRNSIAGKAHRMGLPKRPSPISKPKAAKLEPAAVMVERDLPLRLELRQLVWSRNKCCWPTGDPKKNGFVFCGEVVLPGKPYCLPHCQEAYTTSRDAS